MKSQTKKFQKMFLFFPLNGIIFLMLKIGRGLMKEYSIGLDIGNASVGWAVINNNYELCKFKKRNMWGVRLFDQAQTAAGRRIHRTTARRFNRRRERIHLLQEILAPMILEKDPTFFIRLEESFLWQEDRKYKNRFNLFIDENFTDKDYYAKFPTIYHLRKHLMESKEKEDPRLIYLALHHIIKYRGHFLYEDQFQLDNSNLNELLKDIFDGCYEAGILEQTYENSVIDSLIEILNNKMLNKTKKVDESLEVLKVAKKSQEKNLLQLLVGMKCDLYALFKNSMLLDEKGKGIKALISEDKFEEYVPLIEESLGEYSYIIGSIQNSFSLLILNEVLEDCPSLSKAMVQRYDKYKSDLSDLKELLKKYNCIQSYQRIFKERTENSYHAYANQRGKVIDKKDSQTRFYNLVKKEIEANEQLANDEVAVEILNKIEEKKFLFFLNTKENSSIPHQLHLSELETILERQSTFYDTLKQDTVKIKSLLTFKIPYYVGPLNKNSSFAWIVKKSEEPIRPWNFSEVVDESQSAEAFITRMTNYCTYLRDQPVLPDQSLLYSRYKLFNELNKIRINGHLISQEEKEYMIQELFLKYKSVTKDKFIAAHQEFTKSSKAVKIEGFQEENKFASSLKSEQDFIKILGDITGSYEMIEKIIYWLTVFNDEGIVKQKMKDAYSSRLTESQIEKISKLKYTAWGRLSKKLLQGIKIVTPKQERLTLIQCLEQTNLNFMQLINSEEYDFKSEIERLSPKKNKDKITRKDIEDMYGSPAIKRGVWQSVQIIQEIEKVMKGKPKNIFIEFARSDEESKRTKSRFNQLEKIYSEKGSMIDNIKSLLKELKQVEKDKALSKMRYYLYFIQLGKCMYSKEPLDINRLFDYEVDHIIPQSLIKDDSLDNIVLVKSSRNQDKLDYKMPLDVVKNIQEMKCFWEHLYELNLITRKKYLNLTTKDISDEQGNRFINRQLVETRQISKEVANLLEQVYKNKIVTVKANLVHDLRGQFELPKCREINDYHHAHDAYLVSILGTYIFKRYPKLKREHLYSDYLKFNKKSSKMKKKYGFIISSMQQTLIEEETGEIIWNNEEHLALLRKTLNYKDCFITKRLDEPKEFYNITLRPKVYGNQYEEQDINLIKKEVKLVPIKKGMDVKKYGGYEGVQEAYYTVIECDSGKKKNPRKKILVGIPVYIVALQKNNNQAISEYLESKGYQNVKILIPKVMKNQLIETNGNLVYITSSEEWNNAKQLLLDEKLYKKISKIIEISNENIGLDETLSSELDNIYTELAIKMKEQYKVFKKGKGKKTSLLGQMLEDRKDNFQILSNGDKVGIIKQILLIMQANASNGNLKKIGLTEREGRLERSVDIDQTIFIQQSVTGMFEKRVRV